MARPTRLFRGSELARLLVLLAIVAVGWPLVFYYAHTPAPAPAKKPTPITAVPPPPPRDSSPVFAAVKDKTQLAFAENAAYAALLERARETSAQQLASQSYRGLPYSELWERPERYRGVPIHLEGIARRVLVDHEVPVGIAPGGKLYETYVFTPEAHNNPYFLVTEDMPDKFPSGSDIHEHVAFDGYFFKLLAYRAGDTTRAAPALVGRLHWRPYTQDTDENPGRRTLNWLFLGLSALTLYALVRWALHLRHVYVPQSRRKPPLTQPSDTIDPDALSHWIEGADDEPNEPYGDDKAE